MNNKTYCNWKLPTNAIGTTDVQYGMDIEFAYSYGVKAGVHRVLDVSRFGDKVIITTDKGRQECTAAGTARLIGVEGYNYHAGHGCLAE